VVIGLVMQGAGYCWISLIARPDLPYADLVPPLILAGAGVSMAMPAAQNAVLGAVAGKEVGKASGIFNMARFLGGTFGIALVVALFAAVGEDLTAARAFSSGFAAAIGMAGLLSVPGGDGGTRTARQAHIAAGGREVSCREPAPKSMTTNRAIEGRDKEMFEFDAQ
jgi:hypothetical protein